MINISEKSNKNTLTSSARKAHIREIRALLIKKVAPVVNMLRAEYGITGPFTEADCRRICEDQDIALADSGAFEHFAADENIPLGCIMKLNTGKKIIFLKSFFTNEGPDVEIWCHELGHYFMQHRGGMALLKSDRTDVIRHDAHEMEANTFAELCCMARRD